MKRLGTKATREGVARYAIPSDRAFGVPVAVLKKEAKRIGRNHALAVEQWALHDQEIVKRAGFALLWSLSLHDKGAADKQFSPGLALIESEATDERNFVKKGVSMALKSIARRNPELAEAARKTAARLSTSSCPAARWIGKDAPKELEKRFTGSRKERLQHR